MTQYAIVQHSGVTTGHAEFAHAVETTSVTVKQAEAVLNLGGVVFGSYSAAENYAEAENYPLVSYTGLIPQARGTFTDAKVNGLHIYKPAPSMVTA